MRTRNRLSDSSDDNDLQEHQGARLTAFAGGTFLVTVGWTAVLSHGDGGEGGCDEE